MKPMHLIAALGVAVAVYGGVSRPTEAHRIVRGPEPVQAASDRSYSRRAVLDAIRRVETGGQPNGGRDVTADHGASIGPYCIKKSYWLDARMPDGRYEDCRDRAYAERVVERYMLRYCPDAWNSVDAEVIARTHNGGPQGPNRKSTLPYWRKVQAELEKSR